jgi:hypothetical protein
VFEEADTAFCQVIAGLERYNLPLFRGNFAAIPKDEGLLFTVRNPFTGDLLPIGVEGERGFQDAARILSRLNPDLQNRITVYEQIQSLKIAFSELVLKIHKKVDAPIASAILKLAARHLKHLIAHRIELYVPCRFVSNKDIGRFSIGAVTFLPRPHFEANVFRRVAAQFDKGDPVLAKVKEYYEEFNWIAQITLRRYSSKAAQEKVNDVLMIAINALKLIFHQKISRYFLASGLFRFDARPALLWMDGVQGWNLCVTLRDEESRLETKLAHKWLKDSERAIRIIGSLTKRAAKTDKIGETHRRLIDAMTWFGEAVSEASAASAILRYEIAMEVLLVTRNSGKKNQIVDRGSLLCAIGDLGSRDDWRARLRSMCDLRDKIAHGDISREDPVLVKARECAHELVQRVVYNGIFWMDRMAQQDVEMFRSELHKRFNKELEEVARRGW